MKSMKINAAMNGLRNILNVMYPLITFPYISKVLSVDGVGKYNFSNSVISYFTMIAMLGISTYAVREGAKIRDNQEKFSEFASQIFSFNLLSMILSYILLIILLLIMDSLSTYRVAILILSLQMLFSTIGVEWIYQIYEEYTYITVRSIIFKLFSIILLFLFVTKKGDYLNYVAISVFSTVGSNILNFIYVFKICNLKICISKKLWKHTLPIMTIFASSIAVQIYVSSDITLLGIFKGNYEVAIYSVSSKIYGIVKNIVQSLVIVTIPRLSMLLGQKRKTEYNVLLEKVVNILAMGVFPITIGIFAMAPQVIFLISSKKYLSGVMSLRILCIALLFSVFSWIFLFCILLPLKMEKKFLLATIISATLNIGLNLILIPLYGANGAAITTSLAETIMFVMIIYYCCDMIRGVFKKHFWIDILSYVIGSMVIYVTCILVKNNIHSVYLQIVISVTISVAEYIVILALFGNQLIKDILSKIISIFYIR